MPNKQFIKSYLDLLVRNLDSLNIEKIESIIEHIAKNKHRGIFIIGNGGSAAAASHFATDMTKGAGITTLSLTDNVPLITAIGNDFGYNHIFTQQLRKYAKPEDTLISISVSGTSQNIVEAILCANWIGITNILITGNNEKNKDIIKLTDMSIIVPSEHFGIVEDVSNIILHIIAYALKECK